MHHSDSTYLISIAGLVQGVGFRPFIWRLANEMKLCGRVFNDAQGVKVFVNTDRNGVKALITRIHNELPPLATVDQIESQSIPYVAYESFTITESGQGNVSTGCAPDAATCSNCKKELFDPDNRRYRYPFINCTDCGPRLSIIRQIPYDREFTTMAAFQQCCDCSAEYNDPENRRFHAQPNACPVCGPRVWLENNAAVRVDSGDPFVHLSKALLEGKIVAIKGLGGFHLACDATNTDAVAELRSRKNRPDKAFALMVRDTEVLKRYAETGEEAGNIISGPSAPVVLLNSVTKTNHPVATNIAPGQYQLGFMLPYTPLHHLLFENIDVPLVMTSGNRSGSPQAISNEEALEQLSGIADLFLLHDRPIQNRVDDSVVRQIGSEIHFLRRARGYAPDSLSLPAGFEKAPDLVALGGELKSTLCLLQAGRAVITQHLGDLEDFRTYDQYQKTLELYQNLYQFSSDQFVCDQHPEYLSSKFGEQLQEQGSKLLKVQHHHAHLASCLGENGYPLNDKAVLGICLDGTGFGSDDTLWGGEFLLGNYDHFDRVAHIKPFPLVGGVKAIIEPWRCLYAQLRQSFPGVKLEQFQDVCPQLASPVCCTFEKMIEKELNCPLTSSAGRLFDAVAAALGCHAEAISYEGQAAIELETLAWKGDANTPSYTFKINDNQIDPTPFWQEFMGDLQSGSRSKEDAALAFHKGFGDIVVDMVGKLRDQYDIETVALSGGVMQNAILYQYVKTELLASGLQVLNHQKLPANDASLSFGQALIAAAKTLKA